ncbi:hypothetical protein MTO96_021883 [Rhipicephalus appendiculatus]
MLSCCRKAHQSTMVQSGPMSLSTSRGDGNGHVVRAPEVRLCYPVVVCAAGGQADIDGSARDSACFADEGSGPADPTDG